MKKNTIKRMIGSLLHKCLALAIGLGIWHTLSSQQIITITQDVPICIDDLSQNDTISGPETINVTLTGKRADLSKHAVNGLALHVSGNKIGNTKTTIPVTPQNLFLPTDIKLVDYEPAPLRMCVAKN